MKFKNGDEINMTEGQCHKKELCWTEDEESFQLIQNHIFNCYDREKR